MSCRRRDLDDEAERAFWGPLGPMEMLQIIPAVGVLAVFMDKKIGDKIRVPVVCWALCSPSMDSPERTQAVVGMVISPADSSLCAASDSDTATQLGDWVGAAKGKYDFVAYEYGSIDLKTFPKYGDLVGAYEAEIEAKRSDTHDGQ